MIQQLDNNDSALQVVLSDFVGDIFHTIIWLGEYFNENENKGKNTTYPNSDFLYFKAKESDYARIHKGIT